MQTELEGFKSFVTSSISNNKPYAPGTKGTIPYVAAYLKSYGEKLGKCVNDCTVKGNQILKAYEGADDANLKEALYKEIQAILGKFKSKYWS
jgi:hypothetical protein